MKTAIYIEDGVVQLVLTPENTFEKNALASFQNYELTVQIFDGQFYDCRGGWTRMQDAFHYADHRPPPEKSLILRMVEQPTKKIEATKEDKKKQ